MNVLITAASSAQAYKLEKELHYAWNVIFADSVDLPEVMLKSRKFIKIPKQDSSSFSHQLLTICLDLGIKQIFPLRKFEALILSESRQLFDEYGIKIMVPERDNLGTYLGELKTGKLIIRGNEDKDERKTDPDRGAFLFNEEASPQLQLLTVD